MKFKEGVNWLLEAGYNFGHTITSRFSDSRWSGVADVAFGGVFATWTVGTALAVVSKGALVAATLTSAPLTAVGALAVGTLYVGFGLISGANAVGFLKAAQEKSGLPTPRFFLRNTRNAISNSVDRSKGFVQKTFTFKKKPAADFKKATESKKSTAKSAPVKGQKFDL